MAIEGFHLPFAPQFLPVIMRGQVFEINGAGGGNGWRWSAELPHFVTVNLAHRAETGCPPLQAIGHHRGVSGTASATLTNAIEFGQRDWLRKTE
jgi:hypothetical protein